MELEYETRLREFGEIYEDFEARDVCELIVRTGDRLAAICLDDAAVDAAMKCLHRSLGLPDFPADHEGDPSWRALWRETSDVNLLDLPLAQKLTGLNAYAFFGLPPTNDKTCTAKDVSSVIEFVGTAVLADTVNRSNTEQIERTLLAAQARHAIDEGRGVPPDQLAALARIGVKSMRNALAPSSGSGLEVKDGAVTADSALQWLSARGDFKTSIWRNVPGAPEVEQKDAIEGEILWVPFARDNTEFHPVTCQRAGHYTVGGRGLEQTFADYREALDHLARMRPAPYWRRPNSVGNWGIVTAVGFRPRTAEELGLLSNPGGEK
jgi:hypothetical protein